MTPQMRRLLVLLAIAVPVLLIGRALVDSVTAYWWAASISPAAVAAVTRWQLLHHGCYAAVILVVTLYWWGQYLSVTRLAISNLVITDESDPSPTRAIRRIAAALAAAIALFTLLLHNPAEWTTTIALYNAGVEYGAMDPLLGRDLGYLVAEQPLSELLHRFAVRLVVLGLLYAVTINLLSGGIRRLDTRIVANPAARFLIGRLLLLLAIVIALGYLLAPSRLAVAVNTPIDAASVDVRIVAAYILAGIAFATAVLTFAWIRGSRDTLFLAGWAVLAVAALTEGIVVPAFVAEASISEERDEQRRQLERLMYGIVLTDSTPHVDSLPVAIDLWDEATLADWVSSRDERYVGALPSGDETDPRWLVASTPLAPSHRLVVREASATAATLANIGGAPTTIDDPGALPGESGWAVTRAGVRAGSLPRRIVLAWSLQGPGILGLDTATTIDWVRDPQERVARLVPPLTWRTSGMARIDGEIHWLVTGYAVVRDAPLTTRVAFGGLTVSGIVPALAAVVRASDGRTAIYRDPAGTALGRTWAHIFRQLVHDTIPPQVAAALPYPGEWFSRQVAVLSLPHWNVGSGATADAVGPGAVPTWLPGGTGLRVMLDDGDGRYARALLTATRSANGAGITIARREGSRTETANTLSDKWQQSLELGRLRDSVRATGDSTAVGSVRWHSGPDGFVAWQPVASLGATPRILWVGLAAEGKVGGGRRSEDALAVIRGSGQPGDTGPFDWRGRLTEARTWMLQGDSALGRGDLTAFGRSWEALRRLLLDSIPE